MLRGPCVSCAVWRTAAACDATLGTEYLSELMLWLTRCNAVQSAGQCGGRREIVVRQRLGANLAGALRDLRAARPAHGGKNCRAMMGAAAHLQAFARTISYIGIRTHRGAAGESVRGSPVRERGAAAAAW